MASIRQRAVIAQEQRGVDLAYECLERRRLESSAADTAYHVHNEMPAPGALGVRAGAPAQDDKPLVIMRVSTRDGESFLVGRQPVWNEEHDLIVVSSATQKAIEWRLATQDDPGELLLRRRLRFQRRKPRKVTGYLDELLLRQYAPELDGHPAEELAAAELPAVPDQAGEKSTTASSVNEGKTSGAGETPQREEAAEEAAVLSLESLLLDDLDLPRDGSMRDIVETVQREQLLLVAHQRPGALVIQGGPGTGKTAVGLYRVMWLLDNQHCAAGDVLVVGPHQGFLDYAGQVLPALGGGDVTTLTLERLLAGDRAGAVTETDSSEAEFLKGDDRMADVLRRAVEAYCRPTRTRVAKLLTDHGGEAPVFRFACRGRIYEADADELLALARQALGESGPFNVRQNNFRLRLVGKLLLSAPGATPEDILSSKEVASFVQRVWPRLNTTDVYTRLLDSPRLLEEASPLLTADERAALRRPRPGKAAWSAADLVCLDELDWLLNGSDGRRTYAHIVVDEAQDLTPMQARALARRCPSGSMTILGDLAQAVGPHEYHSWRELATLLTGGSPWTVEILGTGFRLPPEVARFVEPLARMVAPRIPTAHAIRPVRGQTVHTTSADSEEHLIEAVVKRVVELTVAQDGRSTAVITPADEDLQGLIRIALDEAGIPAAVPVLRPDEAKGIEYDHIVVVEPAAIVGDTPAGRRGLYVALTRCTQSLSVVHHAPLPAPIGGPDSPAQPPVPIAASRSEPQEAPPTMSPAPTTEPRPVPSSDFAAFLRAAVAADRKQPVHERLRHRLLARLWESGEPEDGNTADIIFTGPDGIHLFEVLQAEHPTYADLREAATRIAEVRYTLGRSVDRVFLVCAAVPAEPWAAEVIEGAFGASVVWWEDGTWHGLDTTK